MSNIDINSLKHISHFTICILSFPISYQILIVQFAYLFVDFASFFSYTKLQKLFLVSCIIFSTLEFQSYPSSIQVMLTCSWPSSDTLKLEGD